MKNLYSIFVKYLHSLFVLNGILSITGISIIVLLNLFAYSQLGSLPESGEENEFSVTNRLRRGDHDVSNSFILNGLYILDEGYPIVLILFMITLPGLIYGYFGRIISESFQTNSFWILLFFVHLYLAILYLPKVFDWIYCLNCWYWDAY